LKQALSGIASDERRHAELAWQFIAWALQKDSRLADTLASELQTLECELATHVEAPTKQDAQLATLGIMSETLSVSVRREALSRVVLPTARGLISKVTAVAA
jgi:hypothetical protein